MLSIKLAVIEEIKRQKESVACVNSLALCDEVFLQPSSLRLTYWGQCLTRQVFQEYSFQIMGMALVSKHYISLGKTMQFPYYITSSKLIVYSESDAIMIQLCGSVKKFLENAELTS